jgi:AraC-like DNA-binding protein
MELNNDYLTLKLRRLKGSEPMDLAGRGLLFLILKGGQGLCQCGSSAHPLGPGAVLVVDSAAQAKVLAPDHGALIFWFFAAEFEHLFPLFSGREICLLQKVAESFKTGRVYPASSPLARECLRLVEEVPVQFSLDHRSHVLRIVSAILTAEFKAVQPKLADLMPVRDHVLQVFERLATHELLSLPVGELAKKFHCSRRHLNRLFHQHFGVSVAALRMEMRLLKAVSLLVDPNAKITYVAEKCGFNHLGLFNTCFRKRFGASPGRWRKIVMQADHPPAQKGSKGHLFQSATLPLLAEESDHGAKGNGQDRPEERGSLSGLLGYFHAVKTGTQAPGFARAEANPWDLPLKPRRQQERHEPKP